MQQRREIAAGGVVFRRASRGIEVLVGEQRDRISGRRTVRLPKGRLEPGEPPDRGALREVREETGLRTCLRGPLGTVRYRYCDARGEVAKEVHFFLMERAAGVAGRPDGELLRLRWRPLASAARELTFETERSAVARARERLGA